jgi:hypothetical protein
MPGIMWDKKIGSQRRVVDSPEAPSALLPEDIPELESSPLDDMPEVAIPEEGHTRKARKKRSKK